MPGELALWRAGMNTISYLNHVCSRVYTGLPWGLVLLCSSPNSACQQSAVAPRQAMLLCVLQGAELL